MEDEKRFGAGWLIAALAALFVMMGWLMYGYGERALHMSGDAKELNRLLHERTLACAGGDTEKCEQAKKALTEFKRKADRERPERPEKSGR